MKSYKNRFFIIIALTACSFSIITPMDPPKISSAESKELKKPSWGKNIVKL